MKRGPSGEHKPSSWLRPIPLAGRRGGEPGPRPAIEIYGWQVRGEPVSAKIAIDVIDRLQADIARGLQKDPPRNVSGLLIGRMVTKSGSALLVEDYELAGYSRDTGASLLGGDERLTTMAKAWSKSDGPLRVLGFFRSHQQGWPAIDQEDAKAARRLLRHNPNVFLLIRSGGNEDSTGVLFFRGGNSTTVEEGYGEFPFDADALRSGSKTPPTRTQAHPHLVAGPPAEIPKPDQSKAEAALEPPIIESAAPPDTPARQLPLFPSSSALESEPWPATLEKLFVPAEPAKQSFWDKLIRRFAKEPPPVAPVPPNAVSSQPWAPSTPEPAKVSQSEAPTVETAEETAEPHFADAVNSEPAKPVTPESAEVPSPAAPPVPVAAAAASAAGTVITEPPTPAAPNPADAPNPETPALQPEVPIATPAASVDSSQSASQEPAESRDQETPSASAPEQDPEVEIVEPPHPRFAVPESSHQHPGSYSFPPRRDKSGEANRTPRDHEPGQPANPTPSQSSWRSWLYVAATWTIAFGLTLWLMNGPNPFEHRRARTSPAQSVTDSSPIGLQVNRSGELLEIVWNRASDAVIQSQVGFLTIRDGQGVKAVQLDPLEIRSGHVYYEPQTADLGIRLELAQNDGRTASDSIRILAPPPATNPRLLP